MEDWHPVAVHICSVLRNAVVVGASNLKMGKGQSRIFVAKETFKLTDDAPDGTTCGYISFEARLHVFRLLFNKVIQQ